MPVLIDKDQSGISTVWLDNACKRNAMDDSMLAVLAEALEQAGDDQRTRALIIRGKNGCFCAGRDLGELSSVFSPDSEPGDSRLAPINRLARAFRSCVVPVVSVVQGKAAGLGVSLACWSDITVAVSDASFSIPEARAGIAPSITAISLIEAIGKRYALDLCLTGRSIDASRAVEIGLAQRYCAPDEIEFILQEIKTSLIKGAPRALRMTKALMLGVDEMIFEVSLAAANKTAEISFESSELSEGIRARKEGRMPVWQLFDGKFSILSN